MSVRAAALSFVVVSCVACSGACGPSPAATTADASPGPAPEDTASATLVAVADLPRSALTQALSGTWFEPKTGALLAVSDRAPRLVRLTPSGDHRAWTVAEAMPLTGRPEASWDAEGLARDGEAFVVVTHESSPIVERFSAEGAWVSAVPIPPRFSKQSSVLGNKGLESLTVTPSGKFLFTANESALASDGDAATKTAGTRVRILRRDLQTGATEERAYLTEPLGAGSATATADMGVSEIAAVDDDTLLVLERGYQRGYGNTVRIFVVAYGSSADVSAVAALDATTPTLKKRLLVDLASLPHDGVVHPSTQPNPILDNYEALAVGPELGDGRRLLFVTSDDNESDDQVSRILTLAIRL